jgi:choline transporter-like protein 2/4/5
MGSIAFGALIIAIMQMIKLLFEYMRKKYEKAVPQNPCTKALICCLRCFIWCLDYCVKFITKNAYIQIALTNKNFCSAAWSTFCLIVRNCARFSIITSIGSILMFVGKALIMLMSGWIAYLILMNSNMKNKIYSPIFPVIVVVIIAYLIASIFLSVYSFSSTAILHSYLLDEEVKGGRTPKSL